MNLARHPTFSLVGIVVVFIAASSLACNESDRRTAMELVLESPSEGATTARASSDLDCERGFSQKEIELRFSLELFKAKGEAPRLDLIGSSSYEFVTVADLDEASRLMGIDMDLTWHDDDRIVVLIDVDGEKQGHAFDIHETREFAYDAVDDCWWEPGRDELGQPAPCRDSARLSLDEIELRARGSNADDEAKCDLQIDWSMWIAQ